MTEQRYEEDEIDLKELFSTIWKYKWKIGIFTFLITSGVVGYLITVPNIYKSELILVPQEQKSSAGGFGALAGLAGIDMGGGEVSAFTNMDIVLKDFSFQTKVMEEYSLLEQIENPQNLVYLFGLEFEKEDSLEMSLLEERVFLVYQKILSILKISEDKKSGIITISAEMTDRFLAKKLVDIYISEVTTYLRELDMKDIDSKIEFYEKELFETQNIELQSKLTKLLSTLIQKRVLANASEFYIVKKITDSRVPTVLEKIKPKRGLIVVVAFITSLILAIFGVFFLEFIKGEKKDEE